MDPIKAATDDVRESPAVALVETLLGKGYALSIFDEELQLSRLVGANRQFLEQVLPHISSPSCSAGDGDLTKSDAVVVTNGSRAFSEVPGMLRADQALIDLHGSRSPQDGGGV